MTCFTSDFFVEDADVWRPQIWKMIRKRSDLTFLMITKRIDRLAICVPDDWGEGYEHVTICCTIENQKQADYRLPIYQSAPIRHKILICEPLLSPINLSPYLGEWVEQVVVGGESGKEARVCKYEWILDIRTLCMEKNVSFWFKQTGYHFQREGKLYSVPRQYQHSQARRAGINFESVKE